ncbi:hypothetical protein D9611_001979 [Ephemerocybe angulata]|uniref:DNA 3'-5' helicase n=1 Tax=Ephemerocybe angulata TaxID=980116 RepID=A0A8H5CIW8_9AGAR|nr:hypothetical protein D9611_001979 [Tulosesus angulatus]
MPLLRQIRKPSSSSKALKAKVKAALKLKLKALKLTGSGSKRKAGLQPDGQSEPVAALTVLDTGFEKLADMMKTAFKWTHSPRQFQLDAVKAQLEKKDVLIHAGTGSGKTVVAAGPHAHPLAKGKVTIMVSPLIALQEEQVKTFENEFGLRAKAINSSHGGLSLRNMQEIRSGLWQIVVISPEMLLSKVFITQVIRHPDMLKRILGLVVDEAHVVSHWGSGFRKKYGTLGILKALLPRGTPFVAMSATLPPRVRNDVLSKLQYDLRHFLDLNIGNDRHNVSIIIRAMHHAMNTYRDLWFLIPAVLRSILDIKKAFVYADTIHVARDIEDYLYSLCPEEMRKEGFIRPYSAAFSVEYREAVMEQFKVGKVRILICTDAAGMGCNIPDIDIVVQWKLPASISSFVQRAGRAARGSGRTGLAVLLVEKSVYEADLPAYLESSDVSRELENGGKKKKSRKSKVREASTYPKPKSPKEYAELRGALRGGHDKANDSTGNGEDIPLDLLAIDEGLYSFVQTGGCRRGVLTQVFRNEVPEPTVLCCDNCSPELLDRTRPAPPQTDKRSSNPKRGVPNEDVMEALHLWRVEIAKRDHSKALISGLGLLSDDLVELLSSLGPIATEAALVKLVGAKWVWLGKYKTELFNKLTSLAIPPMVRKPRQTPATKRTIAEVETGDGDGDEEAARRTRTATVQSTTASQAVEPGPVHVGNVAAMPQAIEIAQSHPPPASHIPHAGATFVQAYGQQPYAQAAVHQVSQEQINAQWAQYYAEQRAWAAHYEHVRQMQAQAAAEAARQSEQTQPGVNTYQHPGTLGPAQQTPIPTQASQMVTFRVQEYQHGTVAPAPHRTAPPSAPRR